MFSDTLTDRMMLDRNQQPLFYSHDEYMRRRNEVIGKMKEADVELLIIAHPCEEAYAAWLANDTECSYLMLETTGELTLVYGYCFGDGLNLPMHEERRTVGRERNNWLAGVRYQNGLDSAYLAERVSHRKRIGVINWRYLPAGVCDVIRERVFGIEWVDMRIPVSMLRAVRSVEEREAIRHTADMEEKIFHAAPLFIRPGRTPHDIIRELAFYAKELGAGRDEMSLFFLECGLENDGGPLPLPYAGMTKTCMTLEPIRKGYKLLLMLEMNRYGGLVLDTGKTFSIGEPHPEFKRVYDQSVKAQRFVASRMKPGAIPADIEREAMKYARDTLDIHLLSWNLLHGMGNTKTEAPDLRDPTTINLPLMENMHLLCEPNTCYPFGDPEHPTYEFFHVAIIPNTYLVTPNGGEKTVNLPDEIIVL